MAIAEIAIALAISSLVAAIASTLLLLFGNESAKAQAWERGYLDGMSDVLAIWGNTLDEGEAQIPEETPNPYGRRNR